MFNKSLWFILLTVLGGFSHSVYAQSLYETFRCDAVCATSYAAAAPSLASCTMQNESSYTSFLGMYSSNYIQFQSSNGTTPRTQIKTAGSCGDQQPVDEEQALEELDSLCSGLDGAYYSSGSIESGCSEEQPLGDSDNDGIINELDPDSGLYDPNFCSDNPSHSACEDDDGGGDGSGGGDDGGGDGSGGGGLPSSCEGDPAFDETCCREHAEAQCLDSGGLADWGLVTVGTPTCNYSCNNDSDDGSDPGDDGGDGSDGSGDNTDVVNAIDQLKDSNITGFQEFKDSLDSLITQTTQQTDDLVQAQQNTTDTLSGDISDLEETNQTGFNALGEQLEAIKQNTAEQENPSRTNELLEEITDWLELEGPKSSARTQALLTIDTNTRAISDTLNDIGDSVDGIGDSLTTDEPIPEFGDFELGESAGAGELEGAFRSQFGDIPDGTLADELPNKTINISEEAEKFDPMLQDVSTSCDFDSQYDIRGYDISLDWSHVCDGFSVLRIFLIAAATFAVPFIVLGVGKK